MLVVMAFPVTGYIFCLPGQLFRVPYSTVVADRNGALLGARRIRRAMALSSAYRNSG